MTLPLVAEGQHPINENKADAVRIIQIVSCFWPDLASLVRKSLRLCSKAQKYLGRLNQ